MKEFEHITLEAKREFIRTSCYTTSESIELLEISRARLSAMIKNGKLTPAKKLAHTSLFLKDDLLRKKKELITLRQKYRPWEPSRGDENDQ